jgi:pimeloyl-ACP methyl ester carboxylesterase
MLTHATTAAFLWLGACFPSMLWAQAVVHEGYAELPGARIFYIDSGVGVPVVFLHAATGSIRVWEYQIPAFTAAGYRVIAFDRRGWGRTIVDQTVDSAGPQRSNLNPANLNPSTGADDLKGLLDHLRVDRVHLVSTAAGAFVALDFAVSFPQRVRSLVIANTIGGVQDADFLELGRRLRPPQFDALPPEIRELGPAYRAANAEGTRRWMELEKISRPEGARAPAQPMRNRLTFSLLESIRLPVLLLTGGADLYAPPAVMALFAARIRGSESLVVPDAGHSTYWEQPEIFNRAVLNFIRKH